MKLRYIPLLLFQVCIVSLVAMSPEERLQFKTHIKHAASSDELRALVENKLGVSRTLRLALQKAESIEVQIMPGFFIKADIGIAITPLSQAVSNAVEEAFFEEMHPFVYENEPMDQALRRFEKYAWANPEVVNNLRSIFGLIHSQVSAPGYVELQKFIENQVAQVTDENRLLGGKNDFSQRVSWFLHKNPGILGRYAAGGLLIVAVIMGAYHCYAKSGTQDDGEETETEQENIKNDV